MFEQANYASCNLLCFVVLYLKKMFAYMLSMPFEHCEDCNSIS